VVLVTLDTGAVEALSPDKVIVLPDVFESHWSADYGRRGSPTGRDRSCR
jgi:hypothetical protein